MQQMPDKQFDKLFQDHFADAEIEPSMDLWTNIEKEIAPRKKRVLPIYWMAAASVAVVFTAMMAFQKEEKMQLQGTSSTVMVPDGGTQTTTLPVNEQGGKQKLAFAVETESDESLAIFKASLRGSSDNQLIKEKNQNISIALQPSEPTEHLAIKRIEVRPLDLTPKQEEPMNNQVVYTAQVEPTKDASKLVIGGDLDTHSKKSISSVGDLVNFVVDKVDKRDRKLIEFGSDDDEGTAVVGINIGFLKWNKKHKSQ